MAVESVTILTVVFDEEINLLALQARSLARFFELTSVDKIVIIINGKQQLDVERRVHNIALQEYGTFSERVTIILADDVHRFRHPEAGWQTQMALKLLAAPRVSTTWYLVLDAKNHFIRPASMRDFFADSGRALYTPDNFRSLRGHFLNSAKFFGVAPEELIESFFSPCTPSMLHRQSVLNMNEAVIGMTGKTTGELIVQFDVPYTEFILYSLYLYSVGGFYSLYEPSFANTASIWQMDAIDDNSFANVLAQARNPATLLFSIHRLAREVLTHEQRRQIGDLWCDMGLVDDTDSAERFLSTERPSGEIERLETSIP